MEFKPASAENLKINGLLSSFFFLPVVIIYKYDIHVVWWENNTDLFPMDLKNYDNDDMAIYKYVSNYVLEFICNMAIVMEYNIKLNGNH